MTTRFSCPCICVILLFLSGFQLPAQSREGLLGLGSRWADTGITFEAVYTGEVISNLSGGLRKRTEYLDNIDLMLTLKTGPLLGLEGGSIFIYGLGNTGGDPSRQNIGDAQVISNIETGNTFKLYEAWYEQRLFGDRLSLRAGLYDLNSEFDVNETGSLFTQSSHGIGADFSQSGVNGPSIFSTTSLGVRVEAKVSESLAVRAAVLDAVSGDPDEFRRTQIILEKKEGLLLVSEATLDWSLASVPCRTGLGTWAYTKKFEDVLDVDITGARIERRGNRGVYAVLEANLLRAGEGEEEGLWTFFRYGLADDRFNQFGYYMGAGAVYTGLIQGRGQDQLGLAVACAFNGRDTRRARRRSGASADGAEVDIELTYRAQIKPWLAIQPGVHYIINPGTDPKVRNAFTLGFRFEVVF